MGTFFCIYSGCDCEEEERSIEHIVPVAIGGPDRLVTNDVSRRANNDAGRADASLVDSFVMKIERWRHAISGRNGIPDVAIRGVVDVGDARVPAQLTIGANRQQDELWVKPSVVRVGPGRYDVSCRAEDLDRIVTDIQRKSGGERPRTETSHATAVTRIEASLQYKEDELWRGVVKMAIGTAHRALGSEWSRTETAALLRSALNSPDNVDWSTFPIRGQIWPHTSEDQARFNGAISCGEDHHVLLVLNTEEGVAFNVLLFGKYNGTIQLAQQRSPAVELGHAIVVDATERKLSEMTFAEFVRRRVGEAPPSDGSPLPT
jgi:hypothetical protein